jgi:hypothetical protein
MRRCCLALRMSDVRRTAVCLWRRGLARHLVQAAEERLALPASLALAREQPAAGPTRSHERSAARVRQALTLVFGEYDATELMQAPATKAPPPSSGSTAVASTRRVLQRCPRVCD